MRASLSLGAAVGVVALGYAPGTWAKAEITAGDPVLIARRAHLTAFGGAAATGPPAKISRHVARTASAIVFRAILAPPAGVVPPVEDMRCAIRQRFPDKLPIHIRLASRDGVAELTGRIARPPDGWTPGRYLFACGTRRGPFLTHRFAVH